MPARKPRQLSTPEVCPVCGEDVPPRALACPECGADHLSGWREEATSLDGVDLPGEFDYDNFVREEFGNGVKPRGISPLWWLTAIIVLAIFIYALLR
ncbi:MAG: zinc ribbon domain-containing protein [Verrucomicrobiota bacterium]|nr:zinc ribbon domain-containing protein [Verrucomicrobiota bacterium]